MPDGRLDTAGRLSLAALQCSQPVSMKPRTSSGLSEEMVPMPESILDAAVMMMRCTGACERLACQSAIVSLDVSVTLLMPTLVAIMSRLPLSGCCASSCTH